MLPQYRIQICFRMLNNDIDKLLMRQTNRVGKAEDISSETGEGGTKSRSFSGSELSSSSITFGSVHELLISKNTEHKKIDVLFYVSIVTNYEQYLK